MKEVRKTRIGHVPRTTSRDSSENHNSKLVVQIYMRGSKKSYTIKFAKWKYFQRFLSAFARGGKQKPNGELKRAKAWKIRSKSRIV